MEKPKRQRSANGIVKRNAPIRILDADREMIEDKFGTCQEFFNRCFEREFDTAHEATVIPKNPFAHEVITDDDF